MIYFQRQYLLRPTQASVLTMDNLNSTLNHNSLNIFNNVSSNYSGGDKIIIDEGEDPAWVLHMDRTKMVMTVIGLIANIGTTITLMVNGQVCHCDKMGKDF